MLYRRNSFMNRFFCEDGKVFLKLGHSDKHFKYNIRKKGSAEKNFRHLLLQNLENSILNIETVARRGKNFTVKHLCQCLFFNKVAGRPGTFLKKRSWHRCFPVNFAKALRTPFLTEHLWRLLL